MILTLDFESAYGKHPVTGESITLSQLTTEEYVRHKDFKVHGLGVKLNDRPTKYIYKKAELINFIKTFPWDQAYVLAHHAHFDMAILSWRCGVRPKFILDSMSMFRALYPHEPVGLDNMAKVLGLGEKGKELETVKDKWQLTDREQEVLGGYCVNDVDLTYHSFQKMKSQIPPSELQLIDHTVRLFTEPVIQINPLPLIADFKREKRRKRALIKLCGSTQKELASGQFVDILMAAGVEDPPKKLSPSKVKDGRVDPDNVGAPPIGLLPSFKAPKKPAKRAYPDPALYAGAVKGWEEEKVQTRKDKDTYPWAYAFGKDDEKFKMLLDHPDPQVAALVEARMGVKSTIKETRSKRFYKIGKRGAFPVYLNYYGAKTNRWSGGDSQNAQNLTRVDPDDPNSGALRKSWIAPPGHKIVVRDLGQIEARVLAYWAGQEDLLDLFRAGGDPYNRQASLIFGYEVDRKKKEHFLEGMAGKASVLGLGYGGGWGMFQEGLRKGFMGMPSLVFTPTVAEKLGVDIDFFIGSRSYRPQFATLADEALAMKPLNMTDDNHLWHCATVKMIVDKYRASNADIMALHKELQQALGYIMGGGEIQVGKRNLITTDSEGLILPNGMKIRYPGLRLSTSEKSKQYRYLVDQRKHEWTNAYGGKLAENGSQALARLVLSDQWLAVNKKIRDFTLYKGEECKIVTTTHDELVAVAPDRLADPLYRLLGEEMAKAPKWCADLPLKSAGGYADNYGDCEK